MYTHTHTHKVIKLGMEIGFDLAGSVASGIFAAFCFGLVLCHNMKSFEVEILMQEDEPERKTSVEKVEPVKPEAKREESDWDTTEAAPTPRGTSKLPLASARVQMQIYFFLHLNWFSQFMNSQIPSSHTFCI